MFISRNIKLKYSESWWRPNIAILARALTLMTNVKWVWILLKMIKLLLHWVIHLLVNLCCHSNRPHPPSLCFSLCPLVFILICLQHLGGEAGWSSGVREVSWGVTLVWTGVVVKLRGQLAWVSYGSGKGCTTNLHMCSIYQHIQLCNVQTTGIFISQKGKKLVKCSLEAPL